MGKTALALNMAEHVAVENKLPVAVFSMEMSGSQLAMRMLDRSGGSISTSCGRGDSRTTTGTGSPTPSGNCTTRPSSSTNRGR